MELDKGIILSSDKFGEIKSKDFTRLVEVEQDTWARDESLWEYVKCNHCWEILSKEDVYWHLLSDIRLRTVSEIEVLLWLDNINCVKCWWDTEKVFWEWYEQSVIERHNNNRSNISVFRDKDWEIRWFIDWYFDTFENIYLREFEYYYWNIWIDKLVQLMEAKLWYKLPDMIFMCSALCIDERYKSMYVIYNLMRVFFNFVHENFWEVLWIYESSLWTSTHSLYEISWGVPIWVNECWLSREIENTKKWHKSDIFVHEDIAWSFVKSLSFDVGEFVRRNIKTMRHITNSWHK